MKFVNLFTKLQTTFLIHNHYLFSSFSIPSEEASHRIICAHTVLKLEFLSHVSLSFPHDLFLNITPPIFSLSSTIQTSHYCTVAVRKYRSKYNMALCLISVTQHTQLIASACLPEPLSVQICPLIFLSEMCVRKDAPA